MNLTDIEADDALLDLLGDDEGIAEAILLEGP
jgi:hypothetical protein